MSKIYFRIVLDNPTLRQDPSEIMVKAENVAAVRQAFLTDLLNAHSGMIATSINKPPRSKADFEQLKDGAAYERQKYLMSQGIYSQPFTPGKINVYFCVQDNAIIEAFSGNNLCADISIELPLAQQNDSGLRVSV